MTVWAVLRNDEVDAVYDNRPAAEHHAQALRRRWSLTKIVEKDVYSL